MKKVIWKIIFFLSLAVFVAAVLLLCYFLFVKDEVILSDIAIKPVAEVETEDEIPDNPIDFYILKQQNEDIYAWITVDGTDINYPILQSAEGEDEWYYLHHNVEKKYQFSGEIFTERINSKDFTDPNTVLIGHNMINGTKFSQLLKYRDAAFFDENKTIKIYIPGHILEYTVYSAYKFSSINIMSSYNTFDKNVFKDYIDMTLSPKSMISNVREGISVTTEDKIVTLSTCIGTGENRFIVHGVLTNDIKTK